MNLFIQKIIFLQRAEREGNKQKWNEKFSLILLTSFLFSPVCRVSAVLLQTNIPSFGWYSPLGGTDVRAGGLAACILSLTGRELGAERRVAVVRERGEWFSSHAFVTTFSPTSRPPGSVK
jgi:hypothetical protein